MADRLADLPQMIARGNGRSYGDASLNPAATMSTSRLDRLLDFDAATGWLTCESGVLLEDILDVFVPLGWFPPVTPGTKFVSVGGLIASDVHGKNHHGHGSFCDHLEWVDLAIDDGAVLRCSAEEHADLFAATCGGMGLTGIVLRARFRMKRVATAAIRQCTMRAPTLAEAMRLFERSLDWTYSVAWIDCLAQGAALGRSVVLLGEHAAPGDLAATRSGAPLDRPRRKPKRVPFDLPPFVLRKGPVRLFNRLYYALNRPGEATIELDPYFYPLDGLRDWNRIYGRRGFVQYQCAFPLATSEAGLTEILRAIAREGDASFLAVLKRFGKASFGLLSFPIEGYTLALDFPADAANLAFLRKLDAITVAYGGRIYLAKDARADARTIAAGYPALDRFRAVRSAYGVDRRFSSLLSRRLEI